MAYEFNRNQQDKNYTSTVANAAAGSNSATFDLEQVVGGDIEEFVVELALPAEALLSDTKVLTYTVKDSANGSSFTVLDPSLATTQTGAGGAGVAAKTVRFRLPPGARRYVRVEQTATSTPGTLSGSYTLKLLF